MTITVTQESPNASVTPTLFRAFAGREEATGATVGAALDALSERLTENENDLSGTLVVIQRFRPDRFFTAEQQEGMGMLMHKWRDARDTGGELPADEQAELESLVQVEVEAMGARAQALTFSEEIMS